MPLPVLKQIAGAPLAMLSILSASCLAVGTLVCTVERNVTQVDIPAPTRLSVTVTKQPGEAQSAVVVVGLSPALVDVDVLPD